MSVFHAQFGRKSAPVSSIQASASGKDSWYEMNRKAFGYLMQIYGALVGSGLYTDYDLIASHGVIGMTLRPSGAQDNAPRRWISFEHDSRANLWTFRYRSVSLTLRELDVLAYKAHETIATLERRDLPPLVGAPAGSGQGRQGLKIV